MRSALFCYVSIAIGALGIYSRACHATAAHCILENTEVDLVRQAQPLLSKNIDSLVAKLEHEVFLRKAKTLGEIPNLSQFENELNEKPNLKIKDAILAAWNRMNDPKAFARYIKTLAEDTAVEMAKIKSEKTAEAFKKGTLRGNTVLKTLALRLKAKGDTQYSVISSTNSARFREAASRGPFFDRALRDSEHTMTAHILQRDYVDDVIWNATDGHPEMFWKYINSSDRHSMIWETLFDQPQGVESPSSPEWQFAALVEVFDQR